MAAAAEAFLPLDPFALLLLPADPLWPSDASDTDVSNASLMELRIVTSPRLLSFNCWYVLEGCWTLNVLALTLDCCSCSYSAVYWVVIDVLDAREDLLRPRNVSGCWPAKKSSTRMAGAGLASLNMLSISLTSSWRALAYA